MSYSTTKIDTIYHYEFVHNALGAFYKDTLDYFADYLYPRFNYKTMGTYHKAVEYLKEKQNLGREMDKPNLPAIILNPSGDFNFSENGGRQFHRFPNLAPGIIDRLYDPIYQDENMKVTPGFSRLKGEIELIILLNSIYEYIDLRFFLLQIFNGPDRKIYPRYFNSFIIIPDELYNYQYTNEYTGVTYKINWPSAGVTKELIKTTNQEEYIYPVTIKPWYVLTSMTDASTKYGGTDNLSDWRLSVTIEYEIEIPSYLILKSDYLAKNLNLNIKFGSAYSAYPEYQPPQTRIINTYSWETGLDSTSDSDIELDSTAYISYEKTVEYKTRYYHIITQYEADSTSNIIISIPEIIDDNQLILINSGSGLLSYGDHYIIDESGTLLEIKIENVELETGKIIEMYIYE